MLNYYILEYYIIKYSNVFLIVHIIKKTITLYLLFFHYT